MRRAIAMQQTCITRRSAANLATMGFREVPICPGRSMFKGYGAKIRSYNTLRLRCYGQALQRRVHD